MVNRALYRKLGRDVRQRKWALAALAIIIGVGVSCYVGMAAVYRDLDGSRERYYRDYRLADFSVDLKRAPASAVDEARRLAQTAAARATPSASFRRTCVRLPSSTDDVMAMPDGRQAATMPPLKNARLIACSSR